MISIAKVILEIRFQCGIIYSGVSEMDTGLSDFNKNLISALWELSPCPVSTQGAFFYWRLIGQRTTINQRGVKYE